MVNTHGVASACDSSATGPLEWSIHCQMSKVVVHTHSVSSLPQHMHVECLAVFGSPIDHRVLLTRLKLEAVTANCKTEEHTSRLQTNVDYVAKEVGGHVYSNGSIQGYDRH